jgi:hypothetical protein
MGCPTLSASSSDEDDTNHQEGESPSQSPRYSRLAPTRDETLAPARRVRETSPDPSLQTPSPAHTTDSSMFDLVLSPTLYQDGFGKAVYPNMDPLATAVSMSIFDEPPPPANEPEPTKMTLDPPNFSKATSDPGPGRFSNRQYHCDTWHHKSIPIKFYPNLNATNVDIKRDIAAIPFCHNVSDELFLKLVTKTGLTSCAMYQTGQCALADDHVNVNGVLVAHFCAMCYRLKSIPICHDLFSCPFIGVNDTG